MKKPLAISLLLLLVACAGQDPENTSASDPAPDTRPLQERLEKLEAENAALKKQVGELQRFKAAQVSQKDRDKILGNMYHLQTMLETFAIDAGDKYPESLAALYKAATTANTGYFKPMENSINGQVWDRGNPSGQGVVALFAKGQAAPGLVLYEPRRDAAGQVTGYAIRGCNRAGQLLEKVLTN